MRHILGRAGSVQNASSDVCGTDLCATVEDDARACGSEGTGVKLADRCAEKSFLKVFSSSQRRQHESRSPSVRVTRAALTYGERPSHPASRFESASAFGCRGVGMRFRPRRRRVWTNCSVDALSRPCGCQLRWRDRMRGREGWGFVRGRVRWAMRSLSRRRGRRLTWSVCVCRPLTKCGGEG